MKLVLLIFSSLNLWILGKCSKVEAMSTVHSTNRKAPAACGPDGVCKCDEDAFVNCGSRHLQDVPRDVPLTTKILYLTNNTITDIPVDVFWNLTHLDQLVLMSNKITEIPNLAFANLTALTQLLLQGNLIRVLPHDIFSPLTNLQWLYLGKNKLTTLPYDIFWKSIKLQQLYMFNNHLTILPKNLFSHLRELTQLYLYNNNITILPQEIFHNLYKLTHLYLYNNHISTLSHDIFRDLHSLKRLYLHNNKISCIPTNTFQQLYSLRWINLRNNEISSLTKRVFSNLTMGMLYLSGNTINTLPEDLFAECHLTYILDLSDTNISEIPSTLFRPNNTKGLQIIFFQRNLLTVIRKETFNALRDLYMIILSSNRIHTLEENSFNGLNLNFIYLYGNQLTAVDNNPFSGEVIKEVHLYGNKIKNLSTEFIMGVSNKSTIYLDCASLNELPRDSNREQMKCVTPLSLPTIPVPGDIVQRRELLTYFITSGFHCTTTSCVPCTPGTFGDRQAAGCQRCPRGGFFQDGIGQLASFRGGMACKLCNKGTYVKNPGGSSTKDCEVCPGGTNQTTVAGYRACACKERYARVDRYGPCAPCQEKGVDCSEDYKTLVPGYMWDWNFPDANLSNYKRFIANLKQETRLLDSYTSYNESFPMIHECPRKESCANDDGNIEGSCTEGYSGWLCFNCQRGYYSVLNVCISCPSLGVLIIETCAFVTTCSVLLALILRQMRREEKRHTTRSILDVVIARIKILLGFYQVVGEIFMSFNDIKWTGPLVIIGSFISSLELNVLKLFVRPRCYHHRLVINPKIEFILALSLPMTIVLVPLVLFLFKKGYTICRRIFDSVRLARSSENLKSKLFTSVLVLLFIIYPSVCSSIFQLYPRACITYSLDNYGQYVMKRLRSDLDVSCDNLETYHTLAYLFTAVYVIAFPVSLLYIIWRNVQSRHTDTKSLRGSITDKMLPENDEDEGPLADDMLRQDELQEDVNDEDSPLIINENPQSIGTENFQPPWLDFLCENYKDQFWFWEIVELARKVSQTLLITLYGWEDRLTVLLTTCVSVLFLVLHARYRPMKSSYEQRLQMLSLVVIFINVLVAANEIPEYYEGPVSTVLILLNVLVLLIIVGEVIYVAVLQVKHSGLINILLRVRGSNHYVLVRRKRSN